MERTAAAIAGMTAEATRLRVDGITAVGTMGLRTATNSQAFLDLVKDRCGVAIEVISGEEEGRLAYLAVRSGIGLAEAPWSFSTPAAVARSSPSARETASTDSSASTSGPSVTPSDFASTRRCRPRCCKQALDAIAADLH